MLLEPLSEALNRALEDSPRARSLCAALEGRVLRVAVTGLPAAVDLHPRGGRLLLAPASAPAADVTVRGGAVSLLALALGDATAVLRRGDAQLDGDAELARQFMALAALVRPDLEAELGRLIGPIGAHLACRAARALGGWGRQAAHTVLENGAEYLAHERALLVPRAEAEPFLRGVETLRERLDRLEARAAMLGTRLDARRGSEA